MEENSSLQLETIKQSISDLCSFSMGSELILNTKVSYDSLIIKRECARSSEALACCVKQGPCNFYGIKDVSPILRMASIDGICSPKDCVAIANLIRGCASIVSYFKGIEFPVPTLKELSDTISVPVALANEIEQCFTDYGEVLDSASPELKQIRRSIKGIEASLMNAAAKFVNAYGTKLSDNVTTTRDGRVCVLAKISEKNAMGGFIHGESASGQSAYVEPPVLIPLNNEHQRLVQKEQEEIERILFEMSQKIKKHYDELSSDLQTAAILDAIFAKAEWGKKHDGCIATLSERLYLKNARHPLIDSKTVVANTYRLEPDKHLLLITGPNTGGKTVSLKLIGLFTLMTYCGIPVLCDEAEVPIYDHVYVDIGDDQSIEESLSTFSAHLSKLARILDEATSESLVLIDEIGSGTDPKEGESLAIAVLNDLRERKCHVVATTHYGRLKAYGKRHPDILLASVQFDMEQLKPTYQFIEGLTGQSNAFEIAKRYHLKDGVIKTAIFLKNQAKSEEDILIEKLEKQLLETEQLKKELEAKKDSLEKEKKEYDTLISEIDYKREEVMKKAKEEADEYVLSVQLSADEYLEELKSKQLEIKPHEIITVKKSLSQLKSKEEEIDEIEEDKPFEVGDFVTMKNSNQVGQILAINRKNVVVDLNHLKVNAKLSDIRHTNRTREVKKEKRAQQDFKVRSFNTECNVIGYYVEEAIEIIDKFLDDAVVAHCKTVRIVHGNGSGALRTGVHNYLKKSPIVASYELCPPNQGGTGATMVTLR